MFCTILFANKTEGGELKGLITDQLLWELGKSVHFANLSMTTQNHLHWFAQIFFTFTHSNFHWDMEQNGFTAGFHKEEEHQQAEDDKHIKVQLRTSLVVVEK